MRIINVTIFLLLGSAFVVQAGDQERMLKEAESKLWHQPQAALNITDYLLHNDATSRPDRAAIEHLRAKAFYAMQCYDKSLMASFNAILQAESPLEQRLRYVAFLKYVLYEVEMHESLQYLPALHEIKKQNSKDKGAEVGQLVLEGLSMQPQQYVISPSPTLTEETSAAMSAFKSAIELCQSDPETCLASGYDPYYHLAAIHLNHQALDTAAHYATMGLRNLYKGVSSHVLAYRLQLKLAEILFQKEDYQASMRILNEIKPSLEALDTHQMLYAWHLNMGNVYLAKGDEIAFKETFDSASPHDMEMEKIKNSSINAVVAGIQTLHQAELANDKLQWKRREQMAMIFLGALIFVVMVSLGLAKWRIHRLNELLRFTDLNLRLTEMTAQLTPTQVLLEKQNESNGTDTKSQIIPEDTELLILQKLSKFEKGKRFLQKDMSLAQLSTMLDTNTKYLSATINKHKEMNFNAYVNDLRIRYILDQLNNNPTYLHYKVSYLAEESGFSSHSSFTTVFKSVVGMSPTRYIALHEMKNKQIIQN